MKQTLALLLILPCSAWAQETPVRRHEQAIEHLKKVAREISDKSLT